MYYYDYSIGPAFEMENIVKYLLKGIYKEQKGLEEDYEY